LFVQLIDRITESLDGVVSNLKENCIFAVKSMVNTTSDDPQQQEDFVDEIVRQVEDVSCPGEPTACTGHGACIKGRCVCDDGMCVVHYLKLKVT